MSASVLGEVSSATLITIGDEMTSWSNSAVAGVRRTAGERQLASATLCAAAIVVLSGLWVCYLLAHWGTPGAAISAEGLSVLPYSLAAVGGGVLLHAHRPGSPAGWVLLAYGVSVALPTAAAAPMWVEQPGSPARVLVILLGMLGNLVSVTLWYTLPLWFPQGRLTSRWWWLYATGIVLWIVPQVFSYATVSERFGAPNPLSTGWWGETGALLSGNLELAQELTHYMLVGVGAAVLLARLRAGEARQRPPMLLLLSGYLLWAGTQSAYRYLTEHHHWLAFCLFVGGSALWAASFVHFVVRTGSWRISRSARRMLAGLMVTTFLTAGYVAAAAVLASGVALGEIGDALVLVALAFVLGAGLRRTMAWATGLVDRLFYGNRAHPYQVLHTLAEGISRAVSPDEIPDTLCTTVVESLRLPGASLVVHTHAGPRPVARAGEVGALQQHFDLLHHGALIGRLSVSPRGGEAALDALDTGILSSLANQAAPALASLRLQEELRSSREQIVTGREEERRHLRRDIHDGLGPTLAGLRLRVQNATAHLAADAPVRDALRAVSDDLGMAIREVRRITERLGPAPLGELGLTGALRQLACAFDGARTRIDMDLVPSTLPPLPAAVEVATYRIAAEALNNAMRHARAERVQVRVRVDADRLTLTVRDDGIGCDFDPESRGVGLRSMTERAAEIGGHCTIERLSPGTRVRAVLPRSIRSSHSNGADALDGGADAPQGSSAEAPVGGRAEV
ncbi:sensor histidine kinase [Streptomyces sp. NBC_00140]|uniref:sensor histidine kinase n=1 Tax=Streptomyces sp. NBC_00140 TaxID=2975664 RepID=UPI0022515869|nr:sensor histidine kinase [Streptomyces sp. NBC_00140]MCX5328738.1 sensor histidine kinase [Streptomyces sp. NBC_00140]